MEVIKQKKKRTYFRASRWRNDLLVLTAQIAELIRANAPLPGGLLALASEAPSPALRRAAGRPAGYRLGFVL
ncbi:MAG TPA: hypothetical protein PLI07_08240, partial [Candidatus Hydrogenedentes bacterium]|nr:hypothetical protein [Candidatus Hydrogenedentota bacterium]